MKHYILVLLIFITGIMAVVLVNTTEFVYAQDAKSAVCGALGEASTPENCNQAGQTSIMKVIGEALNILSIVASIIAVIMIIIGGLKFITSQGDSQSASSARNTIIYAAVGLIIVALSQIIVRFVIGRSSG